MAVNFNSNLPANQGIAGNPNPVKRLKDVARPEQTQQAQEQQERLKRAQELPPSQPVRIDQQAIQALDAQRQQSERNRTTFDNPDRATAKALNTYNNVANAEKKDELHSLLGVDLYV